MVHHAKLHQPRGQSLSTGKSGNLTDHLSILRGIWYTGCPGNVENLSDSGKPQQEAEGNIRGLCRSKRQRTPSDKRKSLSTLFTINILIIISVLFSLNIKLEKMDKC
ncbi:uncharacterized protein LOC126734971 [Anthonomus grandis grandis]|uniref:uncharacterized protein LOC126734971 n=1 Tax=Anthonomus grandis grandis TaxID=2921223 RepID=UPI00216561B8|nr:uncharacterized protein LOC126734971 [Anthonomus grandis grandis]